MTHHPSTASAEAVLQKQADHHRAAADTLHHDATELDAQADQARAAADHHINHHEACKEALRVIAAHKREHPSKDKGEQSATPAEPVPELPEPTEEENQAQAQTD